MKKTVKRRKKGPKLYWALVTKGGGFYWEPSDGPARPWLNEVWGAIPPMPPPGYERVQVQLVIRKRGV